MPDQAELYERVKKVKEAHQDMLLGKANVVGVGIGFAQRGQQTTGEIALVVMVSRKLPREELDPKDLIPTEIDGVPVDVQLTGIIQAQN